LETFDLLGFLLAGWASSTSGTPADSKRKFENTNGCYLRLVEQILDPKFLELSPDFAVEIAGVLCW